VKIINELALVYADRWYFLPFFLLMLPIRQLILFILFQNI